MIKYFKKNCKKIIKERVKNSNIKKENIKNKDEKQRKGVTNEEHYKETCSVLSGMDIGLHNSCNWAMECIRQKQHRTFK